MQSVSMECHRVATPAKIEIGANAQIHIFVTLLTWGTGVLSILLFISPVQLKRYSN